MLSAKLPRTYRYIAGKQRFVIMALGIAFVGVVALAASRALTATASLQSEGGVRTTNVTSFSNGQASNGAGVQFVMAPPAPTNCPYRTPTLADKWGTMTYVNYTFGVGDIYQITSEVDVINSPSTTSNFYIQMYDADIGASGQYFGLQTTGLVIWSRWNTGDTSNLRPAAGTSKLSSTELGASFISLRRNYGSLPAGRYKTRIVRAEYDGVGDWFKYYVTFPGKTEDYIGDIRFPRKVAGVPASFNDNGGQWNEFWTNNTASFVSVPQLRLNVKTTANNGVAATRAKGHYSSMPNSDLYKITTGGFVRHELGATNGRCHPGDANGDIQLW